MGSGPNGPAGDEVGTTRPGPTQGQRVNWLYRLGAEEDRGGTADKVGEGEGTAREGCLAPVGRAGARLTRT
jgi:hypothetical protein